MGVSSPAAETLQEAAEPLAAGAAGPGGAGGSRAGPAHAALFTPVARATAPSLHRGGPAPEVPAPRARCWGGGAAKGRFLAAFMAFLGLRGIFKSLKA